MDSTNGLTRLPQSYVRYIADATAKRKEREAQAREEARKAEEARLAAEAETRRREEIANAFRLLDLPQELIDKVLGEHYGDEVQIRTAYSTRICECCEAGRHESTPTGIKFSYDPLLRVNKHIAYSATKIKAATPLTLVVKCPRFVYVRDVPGGLRPDDLAIPHPSARSRVSKVVLRSFDGYNTPYNADRDIGIILEKFPDVETICFVYSMVRGLDERDCLYERHHFLEGTWDDQLKFPANRLNLYMAASKTNMSRGQVKLIMRSIVHWRKCGFYCGTQVRIGYLNA